MEYYFPEKLIFEPLVSVAMITYNQERYIAHAIECVLKQVSTFPFEIVIGEDCSTDRTREIVFEYLYKYPDKIRVITAVRNVGFHQNLWRVSWSSRGQFIAFCEGDDYWHNPKKLQMQNNVMDKNPECVLLHTDIDLANLVEKTKIDQFNRHRNYVISENCSRHERYERLLCSEELVFTPTVCVRKNVYLDILLGDPFMFLESKYLMVDVPIWIELARRGELMYLDVSTATLQRLPESLSQSINLSRKTEFIRSGIEMRLYYNRKYGCNEKRFFRIISRMATAALRMACMERNHEQIKAIRNFLPHPSFTHRVFFQIARYRLIMWSYRYWDRFINRPVRAYMKIRYGSNLQFLKPYCNRNSKVL